MATEPIEVVEIPSGSRNKYEYDKERGVFVLDRVLYSSVHYPTDYGYVTETLAEDGDALDALVVVHEATFPGCHIMARAVGVLDMRDEKAPDQKILATPLGDPPPGAHQHRVGAADRPPGQSQRVHPVFTLRLRPLPSRPQCTRSAAQHPRRSIAVRPQEQYEALRQRRALEGTREYAHEYARRAGVEGTLSQGVRRCGMRRSRYVGLARTHLGHVLTAAALNFVRVAEWLAGTPRAQTRRSRFAQLMTAPR